MAKLNITVLSLDEAKRVYDCFDVIVTLIDENLHLSFTKQGDRHLCLWFDDDEFMNPQGPQIKHIEDVIEHVQKHLDAFDQDRELEVLVHCYAGISRSTATAIMLEMHFNKLTVEQAFTSIEEIRPILWPNTLILRHYDTVREEFGAESYCLKWKEKKAQELRASGKLFIDS